MQKIKNNFSHNYKIADNISWNGLILIELYETQCKSTKSLYYKPLIIIIVSMIDAALFDFHTRIKELTVEGVIGVDEKVSDYIKGKKLNDLGKYIQSSEKHDLLQASNGSINIYNNLEILRKLRNRIHIQNIKADFEADEKDAFNKEKLTIAEESLEYILKTLRDKYPRKHKDGSDFSVFHFFNSSIIKVIS